MRISNDAESQDTFDESDVVEETEETGNGRR
jgi:hypothetical protein